MVEKMEKQPVIRRYDEGHYLSIDYFCYSFADKAKDRMAQQKWRKVHDVLHEVLEEELNNWKPMLAPKVKCHSSEI